VKCISLHIMSSTNRPGRGVAPLLDPEALDQQIVTSMHLAEEALSRGQILAYARHSERASVLRQARMRVIARLKKGTV